MELLKQLYLIDAQSGSEKKQRDFIIDYIKDIKDISFETDETGNLYVTKGTSETYPCIVSHLDEVHSMRPKDFKVLVSEGYILGMDDKTHTQHGIGADDKNGIWVCLRCLERYDAVKCVFFVGEETGCIGSNHADMTFFDDCRFVLQCDRRNNSDFITSIGGYKLCGNDFLDDAKIDDFGYKASEGLTTDVYTLRKNGLKVASANMSCGYYDPHKNTEFTYFPDLEKCLGLVSYIVENCTKTYGMKKVKAVASTRGWYAGGNGLYPQSPLNRWMSENCDLSLLEAWMKYLDEKKLSYVDFDTFTRSWMECSSKSNKWSV